MPRLRRISRIARPIPGHAVRAAISFGFDWLRLMSRATRVYKLPLPVFEDISRRLREDCSSSYFPPLRRLDAPLPSARFAVCIADVIAEFLRARLRARLAVRARVGVPWRQMNGFERGNVSPRVNYDMHISDEVRYSFERCSWSYETGFYDTGMIYYTLVLF